MVNSGIRMIAAIVILVIGWMVTTSAKRWIMARLMHLPIDASLPVVQNSQGRLGLKVEIQIAVPRKAPATREEPDAQRMAAQRDSG
jgi:hypothetical protein